MTLPSQSPSASGILPLDARWSSAREQGDDIPSEPSTPAASHFHADELSARAARSRAASTASTSITSAAPRSLKIDAEDEDVKIAIMALGAMKHLDGTSRSRSRSSDDSGRNAKQSSSSRSVSSTAISSPTSSTPATEQAMSIIASSSSASTSTASSTPATLADLPPDFQFPAIIHDEHGNEVRVDREDMADSDFINRFSHLPIVRGTLRAYELGKQHSRVMRYGGGLVESSVKAISRPVVSRIGARLGDRGVEQLDDFACRQLERLYPSVNDRRLTKEEKQAIADEVNKKDEKEWKNMGEEERAKRRAAYTALMTEERQREALLREAQEAAEGADGNARGALNRSMSYSVNSPHNRHRAGSDVAPMNALVRAHSDHAAAVTTRSATSSSGWGSMLVEAGVTAGGLSAAMSEESMKSLKYCLQWLQYATAHIEHQITILRDLIVKLNHGELDLTSPAADNLSAIKRDVVVTIRNVVDVVGKYAGGALPEPARGSVKAFILSLPARWATVNRATSTVEGRQGAFGSSPASPSFSSAHLSNSSATKGGSDSPRGSINAVARQQAAATAAAANRVLTLAVESLDILRSVTVVFGESLDRADLWVERLRVLGLQRKRAHEQAAAEEAAARIDAGMGGALARGPYWESARVMRQHGSQSPGADSNMSIGTTGSSKRRRVKRRGTLRGSMSPVHTADTLAPAADDEKAAAAAASDESSSTETERVGMSAPALARTASGMGQAASSGVHQHFQHPHGSAISQRRANAKGRNNGRHGTGRMTPSSGGTPLLHELSLQERSADTDGKATNGSNGGVMAVDRAE